VKSKPKKTLPSRPSRRAPRPDGKKLGCSDRKHTNVQRGVQGVVKHPGIQGGGVKVKVSLFGAAKQKVKVAKDNGKRTRNKPKKNNVPVVVKRAMEFAENRAADTSGISNNINLKSELEELKNQMRALKDEQTSAIKKQAKDSKVLLAFEHKYSIQDEIELGSGLTAVVKLCVDNITRKEYAAKIISKANSSLDVEIFRREIDIMAKMRNENIIQMIDFYETTDFIYIVQELAYGGELFDRILDQKQFSEKDAMSLTKQMLSALQYMHAKGIVHRDLKPENLLYSSFDEGASLKISDFGFAKDTTGGIDLSEQLGTQGYAAPEVFSGKTYDAKCDIW